MFRNLVVFLTFCVASVAAEPQVVVLWPGGAPGSEGKSGEEQIRLANGERVLTSIHKPSLTAYLPAKDKATGAAIVIAPGGGHRELWSDHEGHNIARWLSERGVAAFILKYRLAREKDSTYKVEEHSLADTRRAVRLVRRRAAEWNVNASRVGVMGFSAGGELAALAAMRPEAASPTAADDVDKESGIPSFQVLVYPAIPQQLQITKETPPAFLVCGETDRQNISQGLAELYLSLKRAGASAELHVYANVGHGFGFRPASKAPSTAWVERLHEWLGVKGMLAAQP